MARSTSRERLTAAQIKALMLGPFRREAWEALSSPHLHLRIGNDPPAIDREASLAALEAFFGRIEGFGCRYCDLWQRREAIYAETDVHFRDAAGEVRTIPCAIVVRATRGMIQDLRFHLDPTSIPR